jgi:tRNA/tmRNA/rRNA uracil-C5-methylase (TrmA/RlmC/RlmD family)
MTDNLRQTYSAYLQEKTEAMLKRLEELGCSHLCPAIVETDVDRGYRNRAKFKIFGSERGVQIMGTDPVRREVPVEESLWILPEWGRAAVLEAGDVFSGLYENFRVDGFEIQLVHGREEGHLILSVKKDIPVSYDSLAEKLLDSIPTLKGLAIPSQEKEYGTPFLRHRIAGLEILAHYSAFFQSNLQLTARLIDRVRSLFVSEKTERIYDLYCGVGLFSCALWDASEEIRGVDNNRWAIQSARLNAERMGLKPGNFLVSAVQNYFQNHYLRPEDRLIINPPRSGVPADLIKTLASQKPEKICLISCFLDTHVRDLKSWLAEGYSIESLSAYDMFPFTGFLETVTLLEA